MNMPNCIKSYKCPNCGHTEFLFSSPALSKEKNVIAKNCPNCYLTSSMIVDFEDELNFQDNFLEKYFNV